MKIDIFTLCSFAQVERGKLNIVGAFHMISAKQTPVRTPLCALAIRMRFEKVEEGQKRIRLMIIDSDGKPVIPTLEVGIQVRVHPEMPCAIVPFAILIQQINLPAFGEYSIDLAIDGHQEASTPLFLRQIQAPQPPVQPGDQAKGS